MENSFFISIENNTNEPQLINLFSGSLKEGVTITTRDYSYQALQLIAKTKGFRGNSITTNFETNLQLELFHNGKITHANLNGRYEHEQIVIDGFNNYLQFTCPPQKKLNLRLSSIPKL